MTLMTIKNIYIHIFIAKVIYIALEIWRKYKKNIMIKGNDQNKVVS